MKNGWKAARERVYADRMDRKQLQQPKPVKQAVAKKPASTGNAAKNHKQAATLLRSKQPGIKKQMAHKVEAARKTRSPAAMIQALDQIRPLGAELAETKPAKAAWNVFIDTAKAKWEQVPEPASDDESGSSHTATGMPAHSGGKGMSTGPIDVMMVPAPPAPFAPAPFPNPKLKEKGKAAAHDAGEHAQDAADNAGDAARDAADAAADAAHDAADNAGDAAHDAAEEGQEAGENAADTVAGWFGH